MNGPAAQFAPWRELLDSAYMPSTLTLFIPGDARELPAALAKPAGPRVNAWVCEGVTCLQPIDSPLRLRETLGLPTIAGSHLSSLPQEIHP